MEIWFKRRRIIKIKFRKIRIAYCLICRNFIYHNIIVRVDLGDKYRLRVIECLKCNQKKGEKVIDELYESNEECRGCSYNPKKDCSEGCMIQKYLDEEEDGDV